MTDGEEWGRPRGMVRRPRSRNPLYRAEAQLELDEGRPKTRGYPMWIRIEDRSSRAAVLTAIALLLFCGCDGQGGDGGGRAGGVGGSTDGVGGSPPGTGSGPSGTEPKALGGEGRTPP